MSPEKPFQPVSEAEADVLKVLWEAGESTPTDLQERLEQAGTSWAYTTVQTLLHRLLKKGYVTRRRQGVAQIYAAAVDREALLFDHMHDLAERICDGGTSPLMHSLVSGSSFTRKQLARFREILDQAEEELGKRKRRPKR